MNAKELAVRLAAVRAEIKELKLLEDELVQDLAAEMEMDALVVEGVGIFERKWTAPRKKWDSSGLRYELRKRVPEMDRLVASTGQIESEVEVYDRVLSDACNMDSGWRSTRLKYYELDPDEWCERGPGKYGIKLVTVQ